MKVISAMSGGVDSAVATARILAQGHEVVGVHLALATTPAALRSGSRGCCSKEDASDARKVADQLGIPFYVWDFAERFQRDVVDDFIESYSQGETPNPCLRCNERIKFEALLERGLALGYDAVATGHYAQLTDGVLRRGIDSDKDQSYVLGVLTPQQLAHSMFPLGDTRKPDIRAEAAALGFDIASKPDSHDICFIPTGDTQAFLGQHIPTRPGSIIDADTGRELATHSGVQDFTIGQRKGLGVQQPAADGQPRYVTSINAGTGEVKVGGQHHLWMSEIFADRTYWLADDSITSMDCEVQIRAHGDVTPAHLTRTADTFHLTLKEPIKAVAPGQAAVIYKPDPHGDIVMGSGTITGGTSKEAQS